MKTGKIWTIFALGISFLLTTAPCFGTMVEGSTEASEAAKLIFQKSASLSTGKSIKRTYLYYPEASTYFDTGRELYFYFKNGNWVKAPTITEDIRATLKDFVTIEMMTDNPYEFHSEVLKAYPAVVEVAQETQGGPPPWAPAHGARAKFKYLYYPDASVYFDSGRELFFYLLNNQWTKAPTLPQEIRATLKDFVTLDMMTENPYDFHTDVIKAYPGTAQVVQTVQQSVFPWEMASGQQAQQYEYRYYPASSVYYDVAKSLFFYSLNDQWLKAPTLPQGFNIDMDHFVPLRMVTTTPYEFHNEVVKVYPSTLQKVVAYQYRYYPGSSVYYDIGRSMYYYSVNNEWRTSRTLPKSMHINTDEFVKFELDTDTPYKYHQEVVKRYPAGKVHYKEKTNVHTNVHSNVHQNVHSNVHNNVHSNVHSNVHKNVHSNVHKNVHSNVHKKSHVKVHSKSHAKVKSKGHGKKK